MIQAIAVFLMYDLISYPVVLIFTVLTWWGFKPHDRLRLLGRWLVFPTWAFFSFFLMEETPVPVVWFCPACRMRIPERATICGHCRTPLVDRYA